MKLRTLISTAVISLFLGGSLNISSSASSQWEAIETGIDYREFLLEDPNNIFVARMDRNDLNVTLESSIAQGRLINGLETVWSMAERYDQSINYWGESWGSRNNVIIAINGSFYSPTGIPNRGQIHSGWYAKQFDELENGSGFVWKMDRSAFIGGCVVHPPDKQVLLFSRTGNSQQIDGINVPREKDQLIVYTPQYNEHTTTDNYGVEVLVEMSQPMVIRSLTDMVRGQVMTILKNSGSTPIPFDHIVLSAHGSARNKLLNNIIDGDEIGISQKVKHYEDDCYTLSDTSWENSYASIGGSFVFLKSGDIQVFDDPGATARHPRTAIAYNEDYIFFIVVDGRDPIQSIGMTIEELAYFSKHTLEVTWGIAQDGGGSSTMVVEGEVVNNTFCNNVFCQSKAFFPIIFQGGKSKNDPDDDISISSSFEIIDQYKNITDGLILEHFSGHLLRQVANGFMMVVSEPISKTSSYTSGDIIRIKENTYLRLGPGRYFPALILLSIGQAGEILAHSNNLNGVLANGLNWWKVSFDDKDGWVDEDSITLVIYNPSLEHKVLGNTIHKE